jgi:hypothetical protein
MVRTFAMARSDPQQDPRQGGTAEPAEPPRLRLLRRLVTALTLTLILGVITIVGLLVIRLGPAATAIPVPESVRLPPGERAGAVTLGRDWVAVVTTDAEGIERIRVLDRTTGAERAVTEIRPAE